MCLDRDSLATEEAYQTETLLNWMSSVDDSFLVYAFNFDDPSTEK